MNNNSELHNQVKQEKNARELMERCCANGMEMKQEAMERVMGMMGTDGEVSTDDLMQCAGGVGFRAWEYYENAKYSQKDYIEGGVYHIDTTLPDTSKPIR